MIIHQSTLASWARCPAQVGYERAGLPDKTNSAAAFGSVMHVALEVFERERAHGAPVDAVAQKALETFVHYWNPMNIAAITEPVPSDGWLPRQGYSELRARGIDTIRKYADLVRFDDIELLATEFGFMVPIVGTWDDELGEPHYLAGSIDRLVAQHFLRKLVVNITDWKTGRLQVYLRHNMQLTAYAFASTLPEFWVGHRGEDGFGTERGMELYERFRSAARRGTWIDLKAFKFLDAGWRGPRDYERFKLAVTQITASIQADIFPLTISGEACRFCPYRDVCGGPGVPDDEYGRP